MALKKPSELFGKGEDNSKISENINGNLNNIKNQYDKVEDLKKQLEGVTSSINNTLSEVVHNNINFVGAYDSHREKILNKLSAKEIAEEIKKVPAVKAFFVGEDNISQI